jgi:Tfp pilus assembly protein PilF
MRKFLLLVFPAILASSTPAFAIDFADPSGDRQARLEFDIGVDLVNHQKYAQSTSHLEAALQKFPDDVDILRYLAFAHRRIAKTCVGTAHDAEIRLANAYYRRALDVEPSRTEFLEYMGEMYLEMDDLPSARIKLEEINRRCSEGCRARDDLAAAIAFYQSQPAPNGQSETLPPTRAE